MLVTKRNFDHALLELVAAAKRDKALSTDSETFCLNWWDSPWHETKPGVFAWQFATQNQEYYFDFHYEDDKLEEKHFHILNRELCANPDLIWFIANAKFDLHQLANYGVDFKGTVHCTKAIERVIDNNEENLSLDHLSKKYFSEGKFLDMAALCKEKGFVTKVKKFGHNDKFDEVLHFDRIDAGPMIEYGKIDVRRCFDLGVYQIKKVLEIDREIHDKLPPQHNGRRVKLEDVLKNEQKLTKVLFEMEREGVLIDESTPKKPTSTRSQSTAELKVSLIDLVLHTSKEKLTGTPLSSLNLFSMHLVNHIATPKKVMPVSTKTPLRIQPVKSPSSS